MENCGLPVPVPPVQTLPPHPTQHPHTTTDRALAIRTLKVRSQDTALSSPQARPGKSICVPKCPRSPVTASQPGHAELCDLHPLEQEVCAQQPVPPTQVTEGDPHDDTCCQWAVADPSSSQGAAGAVCSQVRRSL